MAYLVDIDQQCDEHCGHRAVVELRNNRNGVIGHFCRIHGERRLKNLQAAENAYWADAASKRQ
jgi:hypothetical protein